MLVRFLAIGDFNVLPLLRPAIVTIIVTSSVAIYNDFSNPLYFLPGSQNVTTQLTLFSFMSQYNSQWNMVFADVVYSSPSRH